MLKPSSRLLFYNVRDCYSFFRESFALIGILTQVNPGYRCLNYVANDTVHFHSTRTWWPAPSTLLLTIQPRICSESWALHYLLYNCGCWVPLNHTIYVYVYVSLAIIQKRLKKEKKAKRKLQEALEYECKRREQAEQSLKQSSPTESLRSLNGEAWHHVSTSWLAAALFWHKLLMND